MERGTWTDIALLILRLAVGIIVVAHGAQKALGLFGGPGIAGFAKFVSSLGFAPATLWATSAALGELGGGIFLILGIFPRICAAVIAVIMFVAVVFVHGAGGYFAANNGFEYPLFILMVSLSILLAGGGRLSLYNRY
jgi:putative oxidoreductase